MHSLWFWRFLKCWFLFPAALVCCGHFLPLCLFRGDSTSVLPLAFLWQPLALQGCHITPSSLCCLSFPSFTVSLSLSPASPLPLCMCHVTCVLQRCHYWAARITLPPMSCLSALALSLATLALSLLTLLLVCCPWPFYITFIHKICCPS